MNTARLTLIASAVLAALGLVAAAWALAAPGGPDSDRGSGGARALPVVPSAGGGSEPAPDTAPEQGAPVPPAIAVPPPVPAPPTGSQDTQAETIPDEELLVPLEDDDSTPPPTGGAPAQEGSDSSGGAFSF